MENEIVKYFDRTGYIEMKKDGTLLGAFEHSGNHIGRVIEKNLLFISGTLYKLELSGDELLMYSLDENGNPEKAFPFVFRKEN